MQEDIPNSIEPVFNCFKKSVQDPNQSGNPQNHLNIENEGKRQWVILEGVLKDKQGRTILKYFNRVSPSTRKNQETEKGTPLIEGEPVLYYYGPEKNYGLIIYPRVSVLGHACFYEGYIQYGKPSNQGVFVGANCRYLIHSLDEMGNGVIKCLNYCNMFPFTKCKVFRAGKVEKCTSLLANGFIFYGLDEYGTGFFKLFGLDKLIRGNLNGENFKLEIKGDILYDSDSEDGKSATIEDLLSQLRQEQITKKLVKAKQESENSGSRAKSNKELDTISEHTKSRQTFDSVSKKQSNSLFKIFSSKQKSQKGTNSCSNFEDKEKGINELLREPKFLDSGSAVKTSRSNGVLGQNVSPNQRVQSKSIFFQNQTENKEKEAGANKPFDPNKPKVAKGNHSRRMSKDSDFYLISDSSEQNRSKVNWYSIMNSDKSLATDGECSQQVNKSTRSELNSNTRSKNNSYRGSLKLVPSPIPPSPVLVKDNDLFGEMSRKISRISGSEKSIAKFRNLAEFEGLVTESQKSLAFEKKLETEMDIIGKESNKKDEEEGDNLINQFNSILEQLNTMESKQHLHADRNKEDRRNSLACRKELDAEYNRKKREDEFMWSMRDNRMDQDSSKRKSAKLKSKNNAKKTRKTKVKKSKIKSYKVALEENRSSRNMRATLTRDELQEIRANQNKGQKYIQDLILGRGGRKKPKQGTGSVKSMSQKQPRSTISSKKLSVQSAKDNRGSQPGNAKDFTQKEKRAGQTPSRRHNFLKKKNVSYVGNKSESGKQKSQSRESRRRENKSQRSKKTKKSSAKWVGGELVHEVDSIVGETLAQMDFDWLKKPKQSKKKKNQLRVVKTVAQNTISSIGTIESNLVFGKGQANFEDLYTMNREIAKSKRKQKVQQSLNETELDRFIQNRIVDEGANSKGKKGSFTSEQTSNRRIQVQHDPEHEERHEKEAQTGKQGKVDHPRKMGGAVGNGQIGRES